jgi:tRNA threonylcarbamoyladenosine biosynthesis protein TsaE
MNYFYEKYQFTMELDFELHEIGEAAEKFLHQTVRFSVFGFSGDLGAGKTTFISALCKQMGVGGTVTSPTYSIIQEYSSAQKIIYHIDLYRIKTSEDAMEAGIEDCLASGEVCMVEWPEKIPGIFPAETVFITLEILSATKRKLIAKLPR